MKNGTVLERLERLGFVIRGSMPQRPGGLVVRSIGRARCECCGEPHLYALGEVVSRECRFQGFVWLEEVENPLGSFCNTCGTFSAEDLSEKDGYFRNALAADPSNILSVLEVLEQEALPLAKLSDGQLAARIERLEHQAAAARMALESRKGPYRD